MAQGAHVPSSFLGKGGGGGGSAPTYFFTGLRKIPSHTAILNDRSSCYKPLFVNEA